MNNGTIYTCLHCGTQFVNLDGMLRCAHCGGRLVIMQDEELTPVGTGPETERRITKARVHNQNLAEQHRKLNTEGKEYTLETFTKVSRPFKPRQRITFGIFTRVLTVLALFLVLTGVLVTQDGYSLEEASAIYVEVEVRIGGFIPFANPDEPVYNVDVMLYFANGTYAETITTGFEGKGNSSIAYPIFTEFYATNCGGQNMGQFIVLPNDGYHCHVVLYFQG